MNTAWTLLKATFQEWKNDNASRLAAALSYYTAISVAPLLVLTLTIVSFFYGTEEARQHLSDQIQSIVGQQGSQVLVTVLESADQPQVASVAGILGILVLLWGASGVFTQLQDALNTIWDVELRPDAGLWVTIRERFLSFSMVLVIGFLLLVSLILSAMIALFSNYLSDLLPGVDWLWQVVSQLISLGIITLLFGFIYKVLPDVNIAWRDVGWGAVATAVLFTIGQYLLGIYLGRQSTGSAYGAAGSLVVLLIWIYYSAQIFFFGAEFTQVYARRYGSGLTPTKHAQFAGAKPHVSQQQTSET